MPEITARLRRDYGDQNYWPNDVNVHKLERIASTAMGLPLLVFGLIRRGLVGAAFSLVGGALVHRGLTGHCQVYSALRVSTAHGRRGPSASVPHGQGIRIRHALTIRREPEELYAYWRDLTNLPGFLSHIESVKPLDDLRSHWVARGPVGSTLEWDAEIINDVENELIAWRSLPGSQVPNAGSIRFERAVGGRGTVVTVTLEYDPPGGVVGAFVAKLLGTDPQRQVEDSLLRLRDLLQGDRIDPTAPERGRTAGIPDLETVRQVLKTNASRNVH